MAHHMLCHVSGDIFVELVEGKDRPKEIGKPEFEADYGATGWLMMRMTKPLFGTGKAVVMYSGFFVLKGVVGILAHGVYGTGVINKNTYFPKYCKGDVIEA